MRARPSLGPFSSLLIYSIPYFHLVDTGSFLLATIGEIIDFGFVFGLGYGARPAFYTEELPRAITRRAGVLAASGIAR